MNNYKVLICGMGVMGKSIALDFSFSNIEVYIHNWRNINKKFENMRNKVDYLYKNEKILLEEKNSFHKNINIMSKDFKHLDDIDLIVQCLPEDKEKKIKFYNSIRNRIPPKTIIATNTSSLNINELANSISNYDQFIGMHFFNPAYRMNLVEIVPSKKSSAYTKKIVKKMLNDIEKEYVFVKDSPGFIVNRLLITMINEAAYLLYNNVASKENIDKAMKLGAHHPMGPLELSDYIGIDIIYNILNNFYDKFGEKYKPCPIFKDLVKKNYLGKKTKTGRLSCSLCDYL